jgi:hypothetical protein
MMLPSFLDMYLCFGLISVLHWTCVYACRLMGFAPRHIPN